jgi:hypothetical protein
MIKLSVLDITKSMWDTIGLMSERLGRLEEKS